MGSLGKAKVMIMRCSIVEKPKRRLRRAHNVAVKGNVNEWSTREVKKCKWHKREY